MLIIGIDDAGRGPLIGPMALGGVLIEKKDDERLRKIGVKDSKQVEHKKRIALAKEIKEIALDSMVLKISPQEIDAAVNSSMNLNTLEAMKMAEIINKLNKKNVNIQVVVDCPSINIQAWRSKLLEFIKEKDNLEVLCEHKADVNHPSVSAASILAKVVREEEVEKLKEKYKHLGNMGSGYPADPYTKEFLKNHGEALKDSGIFRKSWATWKALFPESNQSILKF